MFVKIFRSAGQTANCKLTIVILLLACVQRLLLLYIYSSSDKLSDQVSKIPAFAFAFISEFPHGGNKFIHRLQKSQNHLYNIMKSTMEGGLFKVTLMI